MKTPIFSAGTTNNHPFFRQIPVMTPLAEQVANKGYCPRCHTKTLSLTYQGGGMRFMHCKGCKGTVVLSANAGHEKG